MNDFNKAYSDSNHNGNRSDKKKHEGRIDVSKSSTFTHGQRRFKRTRRITEISTSTSTKTVDGSGFSTANTNHVNKSAISNGDKNPRTSVAHNPITSVYGNCPNVSLRYKKQCRIGEGTYGVVYKALDLVTNQTVALKRCLPHHEASDGFPITTLREIQILKEIQNHENIGRFSLYPSTLPIFNSQPPLTTIIPTQ